MGPLAGAVRDVRGARAGTDGYSACVVFFVAFFITYFVDLALICFIDCLGFFTADGFGARFGRAGCGWGEARGHRH